MIQYQVEWYDRSCKLGGKIFDKSKLCEVKKIIHPLFRGLNLKEINVRIKPIYEPNSLKETLEIQSIEVF